jgi:hypothetical protein
MKQIIVMIAMLILGIGIGTMVMGFSTQAEAVRDVGVTAVTGFGTEAAAQCV